MCASFLSLIGNELNLSSCSTAAGPAEGGVELRGLTLCGDREAVHRDKNRIFCDKCKKAVIPTCPVMQLRPVPAGVQSKMAVVFI